MTPGKVSFTERLLRPFTSFFKTVTDSRFEVENRAIKEFMASRDIELSTFQKMALVKKMLMISKKVDCPHEQDEVMAFVTTILTLPPTVEGCFVEAGCYKGGSTAKFSLAAEIVDRKLVCFDSFEGIPDNEEPHDRDIFGEKKEFRQGDWCGTLDEVKRNVSQYGRLERCEFIAGWFEETMPNFKEPIAGAYIDVDLASSTRTCLKYLYPLLAPHGVLLSQDGHLPLVVEVFENEQFWVNEVGFPKPHVDGLREKKLIRIVKEPQL